MRSSSMIGFAALGIALSMHASAAPPAPFAHGDASAGKPIVERDCVGCHVRQFNGDADSLGTIQRVPSGDLQMHNYPHLFELPSGDVILAGPNHDDTGLLSTDTFTSAACIPAITPSFSVFRQVFSFVSAGHCAVQ